eukprot:TRINITY_DN20796_c0_g1_i1.p1 TRINITY_DN20796_c0_g1~~TRINITY_DN20796_c0_g1_i1.p1  ORF type:complete len:584 (-),score=58.80 TRINITY_DN20796_c0_g1_i1:593-2344(-)
MSAAASHAWQDAWTPSWEGSAPVDRQPGNPSGNTGLPLALLDGPPQRCAHSWITSGVEPVDETVTPARVLLPRRWQSGTFSASSVSESQTGDGSERLPEPQTLKAASLNGRDEAPERTGVDQRGADSPVISSHSPPRCGRLSDEWDSYGPPPPVRMACPPPPVRMAPPAWRPGQDAHRLGRLSGRRQCPTRETREGPGGADGWGSWEPEPSSRELQASLREASPVEKTINVLGEQLRTLQRQLWQVGPRFLFSDQVSDKQTDMHMVRISCVGVQPHNIEVREQDVGCYVVFIERQASPGVVAMTWTETLNLPSRRFELVPDRMRLEHGILELFFKERVERTRVFRLSPKASSIPVRPPPCGNGTPSLDADDSEFERIRSSCGLASRDSASNSMSPSVKCFLPQTAFPCPDGRLVLVEHLKKGDSVRMADDSVAKVVTLHRFEPRRSKPYPIVDLHTQQGPYRVSANHRVAIPSSTGVPASKLAVELRRGDQVIIGQKARTLVKVAQCQERVPLYMVGFDVDIPVEMFPVRPWGMWTFGEACSQSDVPGSSSSMPYGDALLELAGIPACSEVELLEAMPYDYHD